MTLILKRQFPLVFFYAEDNIELNMHVITKSTVRYKHDKCMISLTQSEMMSIICLAVHDCKV